MEKPETKPWGHYENLASGVGWHLKKIVLNPGKRTSLQSHELRSEMWFVAEGELLVEIWSNDWDMRTRKLEANDYQYFTTETVTKGQKHRMTCLGDKPCVIIEIMKGEYKEDDIKRFSDDYGRKTH